MPPSFSYRRGRSGDYRLTWGHSRLPTLNTYGRFFFLSALTLSAGFAFAAASAWRCALPSLAFPAARFSCARSGMYILFGRNIAVPVHLVNGFPTKSGGSMPPNRPRLFLLPWARQGAAAALTVTSSCSFSSLDVPDQPPLTSGRPSVGGARSQPVPQTQPLVSRQSPLLARGGSVAQHHVA